MSGNAERLRTRFYNSNPDWVDGTKAFARMVQPLLSPDMTILNLGAGRGLTSLHFDSQVKTVVGLDPDQAISENQRLAYRARGVAESLPFRNETFDLVYMDWVVEHLPAPSRMAREVLRVLKGGGRLLFRTGNLLHYSYAVSSLTPQSFHDYLARVLFGEEEGHLYPTYYRMNTAKMVRRTMEQSGFIEEQLTMMEPDPAYLGMSNSTFLVGVAYERLVNRFEALRFLRACILGNFRKPMRR